MPRPFMNFAASHTTVALDVESPESPHDQAKQERPDGRGIVFVLGPLSIAVNYRASTRSTHAVVLGLCQHQAKRLIDYMRSSPLVLISPMLFPVMWLTILSETRARRVLGRKDALNRTEVELGIHCGVQHPVRRLEDIDFRIVTTRLTVYGSESAWDIHAIDALQEMLALTATVNGQIHGDRSDVDDLREFKFRVRHIKQVLSGLIHWTKMTQHRVQIQLQTASDKLSGERHTS